MLTFKPAILHVGRTYRVEFENQLIGHIAHTEDAESPDGWVDKTAKNLVDDLEEFARKNNFTFAEVPGSAIRVLQFGSDLIQVAPFSASLATIRTPACRAILYTIHAEPSGILHEMGHLLFDPYDVFDGYEFNWFGWEWLLAKKFGFEDQWRYENGGYCVHDRQERNKEFRKLSDNDQDFLLLERRQVAEKLGYLTVFP